jgi:hypothetical protein
VIRLAQQVGEPLDVHREALRVARGPRAELEGPRHAAAIERPELLPIGQGLDQARIELVVCLVARDLLVEIGRHLE